MAPEFPPEDPKEKIVPISIRLKRRTWDRIERIADEEGRSRNEVVVFFLEWACDDYEAAKARKSKK